VGRRLNVDEAIEGSFEKQGDRVRITAQMVRTSDGTHVWSQSYDESAQDMMTVQEDIARAITGAVRNLGRPVPDTRSFESSTNPEAHDLYLRGCFEFRRETAESMHHAEDLFQAAIAKDPNYGAAYYRLAQAEYQRLLSLPSLRPADLAGVTAHVERALELEPGYGEARAFWAGGLYAFGWDWPRADREFRRALEQGAGAVTHSLYGVGLGSRGRFAEAHQQFRMAAEIDPLSSGWQWNEGLVYIMEGNWAKAEQMTRLLMDVAPDASHARLLGIAVARRDCTAADKEAEWLKRRPSAGTPGMLRTLALARACDGDRDGAERYLAQAGRGGSTNFYLEAGVYAAMHRNGEALDRLERSVDAHELPVTGMKYFSLLAGLRGDPRFQALERRVGSTP
jgi:Tfp pilus assembly protein PilF